MSKSALLYNSILYGITLCCKQSNKRLRSSSHTWPCKSKAMIILIRSQSQDDEIRCCCCRRLTAEAWLFPKKYGNSNIRMASLICLNNSSTKIFKIRWFILTCRSIFVFRPSYRRQFRYRNSSRLGPYDSRLAGPLSNQQCSTVISQSDEAIGKQ